VTHRQPRANIGRFADEDEALRALVERLAAALDPVTIWLFGSRSRGTHRPDSDFDLLVVTDADDGDDGLDYERAYAPVRGLGVGCDIVPIRVDEFVDELDHPTSMFADIARNGIKVYGRRSGVFIPLANKDASGIRPPIPNCREQIGTNPEG
jgi:uncharacterized protein